MCVGVCVCVSVCGYEGVPVCVGDCVDVRVSLLVCRCVTVGEGEKGKGTTSDSIVVYVGVK